MRPLTTVAPGTEKQSLAEWLRHAFDSSTRMVDDVHLDELFRPADDVRSGMQWLVPCCEILREVKHFVPRLENLAGVRKAIVALPLLESQHIKTWKTTYWRMAGVKVEPPSLILVKNESFDDRYDEEYFRRLDLPIRGYADVSAVFRSYRDVKDCDRPGEFGNAIFLVSCVA
jgi:hypothetical protein